jgi:hypothetical protein
LSKKLRALSKKLRISDLAAACVRKGVVSHYERHVVAEFCYIADLGLLGIGAWPTLRQWTGCPSAHGCSRQASMPRGYHRKGGAALDSGPDTGFYSVVREDR